MDGEFDAAILIGRFQPFHKGHLALLTGALKLAPRVFVILGSSFHARNAKNPFTWQERAAMIRLTLDASTQERVTFIPVRDYYNDKRWCAAVTALVAKQLATQACVALVGFEKDASSYYLNLFPDWQYVALPKFGEINATSIRHYLYDSHHEVATSALLSEQMPEGVVEYLKDWLHQPHFALLKEEHLSLEENRRTWGNGPFVTADAVVTIAGHVLLVERKNMPGKGLLALPGGFLELRERVLQCAIRELHEETGLDIAPKVLEGALQAVAVFDHPDRSLRGRTITHAHWFDFEKGGGKTSLPEVRGQDDAAKAQWIPIKTLSEKENLFFDDHFHILNHFLSLYNQ